jgi:hypothetical protein
MAVCTICSLKKRFSHSAKRIFFSLLRVSFFHAFLYRSRLLLWARCWVVWNAFLYSVPRELLQIVGTPKHKWQEAATTMNPPAGCYGANECDLNKSYSICLYNDDLNLGQVVNRNVKYRVLTVVIVTNNWNSWNAWSTDKTSEKNVDLKVKTSWRMADLASKRIRYSECTKKI